jgi:hypothetical protein
MKPDRHFAAHDPPVQRMIPAFLPGLSAVAAGSEAEIDARRMPKIGSIAICDDNVYYVNYKT